MKYLAPLTAFTMRHIQIVRSILLKDLALEELEWKAYFRSETSCFTDE